MGAERRANPVLMRRYMAITGLLSRASWTRKEQVMKIRTFPVIGSLALGATLAAASGWSGVPVPRIPPEEVSGGSISRNGRGAPAEERQRDAPVVTGSFERTIERLQRAASRD